MKNVALLLSLTFISSMTFAKPTRVRNIILLIGDGFGPQQYSLGMIYAEQSPKSPYRKTGLNMKKVMNNGQTGYMMTYPNGAMVVDSAASATQIATGHFSGSEMIGVDYLGNKQQTILEKAKKSGRATGLVSSTRITHATPAAFAAHQPHRSLEYAIAEDLINTGPDLLLSGGLRYFLPESVNDKNSAVYKKYSKMIPNHIKLSSKRGDEKDILAMAQKKGYDLVFSNKTLQKSDKRKILGLFHHYAMPNAIEEEKNEKDPNRKIPTLADMTRKALDVLSKDRNGFFLMVEGGQIDWAGHGNDVGTMLHEVIQYDKAVGVAYDFAKNRKDTLIVMVSDHETGSFGFSYSRNDVPKGKKLKGNAFKHDLFRPHYNFGDPNVLDKIYAQKKSFTDMIAEFDRLPKEQKNAKSLRKIVQDNISFPFSLAEAKRVLETEHNPYQVKGHKYLSKKTFPKIDAFEEFYVYGAGLRSNLIGWMLAKEQQVVWGTGTHTSTFVPVIAYGPNSEKFKGMHHSTEVSRLMMKAFGFKTKFARR